MNANRLRELAAAALTFAAVMDSWADGGALVVLRLPSVNHQDAAQATALEHAVLEDGKAPAGRA